mgnify:CR=1 FL=1|tara:strand:+ start:271 stop:1491 length:1221 start_codon:yes stop_codon:yes gene_type:complete
MSEKTNDEKLKILRERLAQIKQKHNSVTDQESYDQETTSYEQASTNYKSSEKKSSNKIKYLIIIIFLASFFYIFNNLNLSSIQNKTISQDAEVITNKEDSVLSYNLNLQGNNIVIVNSFDNESSSKVLVNDLKVKGYKTNYHYLPNVSNSNKKIYEVFIGPYENLEEASQWIQNINKEVTVISIADGNITKMKSKTLLAQEKAENERLVKEKAENERLAIELAKQKAENERLAKEKEENERLAKEKEENERLAQEKAKNERLVKIEEKNQEKINQLETDKENIELERKLLLDQKAQLEAERIQLDKDRKKLLTIKKNKNNEISITYFYKFSPTVNDEGFLTITNNAGYPTIKQNFENLSDQGGIDSIINKLKFEFDSFGILIENIFYEKSGTSVPIYDGNVKEVTL